MAEDDITLDIGSEEMGELLEGAGWILAGTAFGLIFSFFSRAVPARLLGANTYGLLLLGFTIISITSFLSRFGLPQGITRYVPRYDEIRKQSSVVWTGYTLATGTSIVLVLFLFVFATTIATSVFKKPRLGAVIRILSPLLLLITFMRLNISIFRSFSLSRERVLIQDILFPVSKFVLISGAVVIGLDLLGAAVGLLLSGVVTVVISGYLIYAKTDITSNIGPSDLMIKELLFFSAPLVISSVFGTVLNHGDNLLIGYYLTSSSVGIYGIAYLVSKLQTSILAGFSFLFFPMFSRFESNQDYLKLKQFMKLVTKIVMFLTTPLYLTLIFFPRQVLSLFGQDYVTGSTVLLILSTGIFIYIPLSLAQQGLMSYGYTNVVMYVSATGAISNILLNIYLIPIYGLSGAAFASALSYSTTSLAYNVILYNREGIHPFSHGFLIMLAFAGIAATFKTQISDLLLVMPLWSVPIWTVGLVLAELGLYWVVNGIQPDDMIVVDVFRTWVGKFIQK